MGRRRRMPYTTTSERLLFALSAAFLSPSGPNVSARLRLAMCRRCLGCSFSGRLANSASAASMRSVYLAVQCNRWGFRNRLLFSVYSGSGQRQKYFLAPLSHTEVHRDAHEPHVLLRISAAR